MEASQQISAVHASQRSKKLFYIFEKFFLQKIACCASSEYPYLFNNAVWKYERARPSLPDGTTLNWACTSPLSNSWQILRLLTKKWDDPPFLKKSSASSVAARETGLRLQTSLTMPNKSDKAYLCLEHFGIGEIQDFSEVWREIRERNSDDNIFL